MGRSSEAWQVLIPTVEREGGYTDLEVCLHSLRAYASSWRVIVGWRGSAPPPIHVGVTYTQVPPDVYGFGPSVRHLLLAVHDEAPAVVLNDDTVVTPTTAPFLEVDWARVDQETLGLMGLRSNFVAGAQNIRQNNQSIGRRLGGIQWRTEDQVLSVPVVFGVAFTARPQVLRLTTDWQQLHWYSDTLLSYDLAQRGYRHYVSRAYVHHHGSRSTPSWDAADAVGRAWLAEHRPEVLG